MACGGLHCVHAGADDIEELHDMTDKKPPELVFAPGCFDNFDGTPEELAAMLADLHQMVEDGTLMENSTRLTEEEEEEAERKKIAEE